MIDCPCSFLRTFGTRGCVYLPLPLSATLSSEYYIYILIYFFTWNQLYDPYALRRGGLLLLR